MARLTPEDRAALAHWEQRSGFVVLLAALTPIVLALAHADDLVWAVVAVVSWLVCVVDLVVRLRLVPGYLRTWSGRVDLAIVVATAPWFLIPALVNSRFLSLLRLARVARVVLASHDLRRLAARLNHVVIFSVLLVAGCSYVVTRAEGPANGFDGYGDGLWWGIVTFTTVGYGDLVPDTVTGRLTGTLASTFGLTGPGRGEAVDDRPGAAGDPPGAGTAPAAPAGTGSGTGGEASVAAQLVP